MSQAKECWSCQYYRAYYKKGFCTFVKQKVGWCGMKQALIEDNHNTCGRWNKIVRIPELRKAVALKKLNQSVDILCEIKQILLEDQEEARSHGCNAQTTKK